MFTESSLWLQKNLGYIFDISSDTEYSPDDIQKEFLRLKSQLHEEFGVKPGDKIIIKNGNNAQFFFQLFAIWSIGAVAIPTSQNITEVELNQIRYETGAKIVLTNSGIEKFSISEVKKNITIKNEALILFTSGTSRLPKGVVISLDKIIEKIKGLRKHIPENELERTLNFLPTSFGHGLIGCSLLPLLSQKRLYIMPTLDIAVARTISTLIDRHGITFFSSVPGAWPMILSGPKIKAKSSLKRVHCASSPLPQSTVSRILKWVAGARVFDVYGTTETLSWVACKEISNEKETQAFDELWEAEIYVDENQQERRSGEIIIKTNNMFSHYLNDPRLTRKHKSKSNLFKTQDCGYINDQMEIVITGRLINTINKNGQKISPERLDEEIMKIECVQDACAFGYEDEIWGEKIGAAIVLKENSAIATEELKSRIIKKLSEAVSQNKLPDMIWFVDELGRNERGKLNRSSVKNILVKKK